MLSEEDRKLVLALTLDNAIRYGGRPNKGSIIGKFLYFRPEYKNNIKNILPEIDNAISHVIKLGVDRQREVFEEYKRYIPKIARAEIKGLPPLPGAVKGRVVTRFAPNPDFILHLGSVRPLLFSYIYAKMYDGKFIVRFEDTDPRLKRPRPEYYRLILEDIRWLGIEPDEIYYQSDRLEIYYETAEKLLERQYAYICTCPREEFSRLVKSGIACPHREQPVENNMKLFDEMLDGKIREGRAVLRIKTDLSHPNPSIRDWPALRVVNIRRYPHPRIGDKYYVWPLYNFSCAIDDHYMGITHVIRGVEHKINEEKQKYIYKYMGWEPPIAIHHGRIAIPGGILSKSKILAGIREGIYTGVDDPQIATLAALRRRGFQPDAIKNVILRGGLKATLMTIDWSLLAAENRAIVDKGANRYFGVVDPIVAEFKHDSQIRVSLRKHPDRPERGDRTFVLKPINKFIKIYIDKSDYNRLREGQEVRLMGIGNFMVETKIDRSIELRYIDNDIGRAKAVKMPFIHWIPTDNNIRLRMIYPGKEILGLGENTIVSENINNIIQLERIGFFRVEKISETEVTLIYTHS